MSSVYGGKQNWSHLVSYPPGPPKLPNIKDNLLFPMLFTSKFRLRQTHRSPQNISANSFQISSLIQPFCVVHFITVMRLKFFFWMITTTRGRSNNTQVIEFSKIEIFMSPTASSKRKCCKYCATKWACKQEFGCVCADILWCFFRGQWHKQHMHLKVC